MNVIPICTQKKKGVKLSLFFFHWDYSSGKPYEVRFKITNWNVEEMLVHKGWEKLMSVLTEDLWEESAADLNVTYLTSATQKGDRLPARPDEREG